MILLIHDINKIVEIRNISNNTNLKFDKNKSIGSILYMLSKEFPDELILWSNELVVDEINYDNLESIFHHDAILASYATVENYTIPKSIGYIEQTPFLKVKKEVCYPTWLMSSTIGGAKGLLLANFGSILNSKEEFPLVLNHLSKVAQKRGILCYSNPGLLLRQKEIKEPRSNIFFFVRRHYKIRWMFLLFLNIVIYEKKFPLGSFFWQLLFSRKCQYNNELKNMEVKSTKEVEEFSIDVIIPTVGRKKYLFDVLCDLADQMLLPKNVIIVEQTKDGNSELDYISQNWPFRIKHKCIKMFGACKARNLALQQVTSNWVFFADDDIRIPSNFIENAFKQIKNLSAEALTYSCLQDGEVEKHSEIIQWSSFGSGCSIVKSSQLQELKFDEALEFGYGEDFDFGMQLRNNGVDILYIPFLKLQHLKAPVGGFRKKIQRIWEKDDMVSKPSPTVMVTKLKHSTKFQILGYKTLLFIKFYKHQNIRNPFRYLKIMKQRWLRSQYWAHKLLNREV